MNKNQSTVLALVILIIIAVVIGLLVSKQRRDIDMNREPAMNQEMPANESGTPLSNTNDTQSIESDLNATSFTSLDEDMNDSVSGN